MSQGIKMKPAVPASPSWKLPMKTKRQFGVVNPPTPSMGRSLLVRENSMESSGLGGSFVVLRPLESNVYPRIHHALHSPQSSEPKNKRPFLTLALLKLAQILPDFLEDLATPTPSSVAKACARMESMATPRSTGPLLRRTESPASISSLQRNVSEPRSTLFQPLELIQQMLSITSPASSRPASPFSSPSESPSSSLSAPCSPSALALEKEWERLVAAPFWLLAAAEIFTADCCCDPSLIGLYQRCTQDLFRLQHLLCEPVLATEELQGDVLAAAQKVRALLDAVLIFAAAQSEFIRIQSCLHEATDTVAVAQAATSMGTVLARLDAMEDPSLSLLFQRTYQHVQGWKFALEACLAIEQCLFLESIVLMRQWQHAISTFEKTIKTRQTLWLESCFKKVLATLPVFLDCTRVHASPMYGLVNTKFPVSNGHEDLESDILEFLRRQERLSALPTAIVVVLDAEATSNFHPEQGFCLCSNTIRGDTSVFQSRLPPVFIRSTLYSASTNSSSTHSLLPVPHSGGTPAPSPRALQTGRKTYEGQKTASFVMEYFQNDAGSAVPWPHSEWETLAELLGQAFPDDDDDVNAHRTHYSTSARSWKESHNESVPKEDFDKRSLRTEETQSIVANQEGRYQDVSRERSTSLPKNPLSELAYPNPVTYRDTTVYDGPLEETGFMVHEQQPSFFHLRQNSSFNGIGTNDPAAHSDSDFPPVNVLPLEDFVSVEKTMSRTSFHLISISKWTSLALMVKMDEDDGPNRRYTKRQQLSDGELHRFLTDTADRLRVCLLWKKCLPESQVPIDKQTKEPILSLQRWARSIPTMSQLDFDSSDNPKQQLYDPWMSDGRVSLFLDQVKAALGLRSANLPDFQAMTRASSWWWGPSSSIKSKSPKIGQRRKKKYRRNSIDNDILAEGAAALFLGPSLSRAFMKDD